MGERRRGRRRRGTQPPVTIKPMCQLCRAHGDGEYRRTQLGVRLCEVCWDALGDDRDRAELAGQDVAPPGAGGPASPHRPVTVSRDELRRLRHR